MSYLSSTVTSRRLRCVGIASAAVAATCVFQTASQAATQPFISIVSGNGTSSNLTVDSNGTISAANTASVSFSNTGPTVGYTVGTNTSQQTVYDGYDLKDHVFGTPSTATSTGYNTTPVVGDNGSGTYDGGPVSITAPNGIVLNSENITPYTAGTTTGDVGYYKYTVSFTLSAASNQPFIITGYADADNEIQDVILDYGSTTGGAGTFLNPSTVTQTGQVLALTALNGTGIQTEINAASNVSFKTTSAATNLGGAHTLSFIVYNQSGPTDINFGFSAQVTPEPTDLDLFLMGCPIVMVLCIRRPRRQPGQLLRS